MSTDAPRPIRIALVNDSMIVVKGLEAMLAPYAERVQVVELDSLRDPPEDVDVILKDAFGMLDDLSDFVDVATSPVVLFAHTVEPAAIKAAVDSGAAGFVSKSVSAERLVAVLERVVAGEQVVETDDPISERPEGSGDSKGSGDSGDSGDSERPEGGDWPGSAYGLTERESEVLVLICRGLSNVEVAETLFLSINSVKTYIRTAYRRIGATSRAQAVIWGLDHGFAPRAWRHRPPSEG